ncbi:hypothetical protein [Streptomyces afghaniensis]|uniref:hypothetical protein n=1 Tax=Streptomyces afghaniensis TaxID=66865 RepID=UPI002780DD8B|nr:hypothetical protein [Streptomyces afghaniensis]MDQ1016721.1 hypothetical protein [Streptomyces afghaniensis]
MSRRHPRIVLESTLPQAPEVVFYMLKHGALISDEDRYFDRDKALAEVERRNATEPGHTCLGIPSRITACEGCPSILLDCIYEAEASHLTHITWQACPSHDYWGQNEQTSLIASWVD